MTSEFDRAETSWSPEQYHRYSDQRSRPFFDLLSQVRLRAARHIVDLGCGSGELTAVLAERWPTARVHGVDSSIEMIAAAQAHTVANRLTFERADLRTWSPASPIDLLFSNAALQWAPNHDTLLPRLAATLAPHGVFAFQVPGNFEAPSHALLVALRTSPRWNGKVGEGASRHLHVESPAAYLELLTAAGCAVDTWETTYMHVLQGADAVLEWVKGTALRPVLSALDADEQREFLGEYARLLREAYPAQPFGTPFPFRRIFSIATRL